MKLMIPTLLGLERVVADELPALGVTPDKVTVRDGRVSLEVGDAAAPAIARLNLWIRCGERVLLELAEGPAPDFDALFDLTRSVPWEEWVGRGQVVHVEGFSRRSALHSVPACQSVVNKAIVERLLAARGLRPGSRLPEDPARGTVPVRFRVEQDRVTLLVDTTGPSLHKRGYRPLRHEAPLRETLAAGLILLSRWNPQAGEALLDPFCGSGTIPIEAAMIRDRVAPGRRRSFSSETWDPVGPDAFARAREEADDLVRPNPRARIAGTDNDAAAVAAARANARSAGVTVAFSVLDVRAWDPAELEDWRAGSDCLVVGNPPYGERLLSAGAAAALTKEIGKKFLPGGQLPRGTRLTFLSADGNWEQLAGRRADKRRKLYNGMIKCTMYHYFKHPFAPRPGKEDSA